MENDMRGMIFDFNGVLSWDTDLHEQAWRQISAELRGEAMSDEEMKQYMHGRTNAEILAYVLQRPVSAQEAAFHSERKEVLYRQLFLARGRHSLSPGATLLLDALVQAGWPHTIASSSGWSNMAFFIEQFELGRWFNIQKIVYDDGSLPGKPAPDMYLRAAERIGLSPADCVVVEDAPSGIEAARRAGIGWIVAIGPKERAVELASWPGVNQVIMQLDALLPLVQGGMG